MTADQNSKELQSFRGLTGILVGLGMSEDRAEIWARAAVDRYRRARRRGVAADQLFNRESAERYARLEAGGSEPRKWF